MLKETTDAFDGAHGWQISTDHESDALPTVPRRLLKLDLTSELNKLRALWKIDLNVK